MYLLLYLKGRFIIGVKSAAAAAAGRKVGEIPSRTISQAVFFLADYKNLGSLDNYVRTYLHTACTYMLTYFAPFVCKLVLLLQ